MAIKLKKKIIYLKKNLLHDASPITSEEKLSICVACVPTNSETRSNIFYS